MNKPSSLRGLTKAKARVRIAQDVIECLDAGKIKAAHTYAYLEEGPGAETSMQELLYTSKKACQVCALGACLVSVVARDNEVYIKHGNVWSGPLAERLLEFFSLEEQALIETAYEGQSRNFTVIPYVDYSWRRRFPGDTERMRAIMQNIVDHGGTFRPEVLP